MYRDRKKHTLLHLVLRENRKTKRGKNSRKKEKKGKRIKAGGEFITRKGGRDESFA